LVYNPRLSSTSSGNYDIWAVTYDVDTISPFCTGIYTIINCGDGILQTGILASLTWCNESVIVTNNNWSSWYFFTWNGSFTFEYRDDVGHTWSTIVNVNSIFTWEQCDDGNMDNDDGCNNLCELEIPSCELLLTPTTWYTHLTWIYTITWINIWWMNFDSLTYWDESFEDNLSTWTLIYSHLYSGTWIYTWILTVSNIYSWAFSWTCSASLEVFTRTYCWDNDIQTPNSSWDYEQCDDGNMDNDDGCNNLCELEMPSCELLLTPTTWYTHLTWIYTITWINIW
jgi:cysteine-rich repeat protein